MNRRDRSLLVFLLAGALLIGCGGGDNESGATATAPDTTTATTQVVETTAAPTTEPVTTLPATLDLSALPGRIAILSESCGATPGNGENNLCVLKPDGSGLQLVSQPGDDLYLPARWSYDDKFVMFTIPDGSIILVDPTTGQRHEHDFDEVPVPGMSPDGNWQLFTELDDILLGHPDGTPLADGSGSTAIIVDPFLYPEAGTSWAPDSTHFTFVSRANDDGSELACNEVWIGSVDGAPPKRLTHTADGAADLPICVETASWSPDGSKILIVFGGDLGRAGGLFTVEADGGSLTRIAGPTEISDSTILAGTVEAAAWSPDGRHVVAVESDGNGSSQLVVMNAEGGQRTLIEGLPAAFLHRLDWVTWAPG